MEYITREFSQDVYLFYGYLFKTISLTGDKFVVTANRIISRYRSLDHRQIITNILINLPHFLSIIFLGFLAVIMIAINIEKDNGIRVINLTTGSMRPSIPIATVVFTKPSEKYDVGDVITYQEVSTTTGVRFSRTFTHRIIEIKGEQDNNYYITKGDANDLPDPYMVKKNDILGKVIFTIPYMGYLLLLIKTIPGFISLIAIPTIFLIVNEVQYIKKELGLR